jgi:hypothetical protein
MIAMIRYVVSSMMVLAGTSFVQSEPGQALAPLYAADRIEAAFAAISELTSAETSLLPLAVKGDLPPGCVGPFKPEIDAECINAAYEPGADPRGIVEDRIGSSSILTQTFGDTGAALVAETARNRPSAP